MLRRSDGKWVLTDDEMNTIGIYLSEASDSYANRGRVALARDAYNYQKDVFEVLLLTGYYDK